MIQRMIGAALFNAETYEEIEADPGAIGQAILVVLLVTLCGAVGGIIGGLLGDASALRILLGVIAGLVFGIVRWAIWVSVLSLVGGMMLRTGSTHTSWAEIGRVVGFAYTPGILSIFSFVPFIGWMFPGGRLGMDVGRGDNGGPAGPGFRIDRSRDSRRAARRRDRFHPVDHHRDRPGCAAVV